MSHAGLPDSLHMTAGHIYMVVVSFRQFLVTDLHKASSHTFFLPVNRVRTRPRHHLIFDHPDPVNPVLTDCHPFRASGLEGPVDLVTVHVGIAYIPGDSIAISREINSIKNDVMNVSIFNVSAPG